MKVDVSRTRTASPGPRAGFVMEHVSALMTMAGIKSLTMHRYEFGMGANALAAVEFFDGVPPEIMALGVVIKEALGQVLMSADIMKVSISLDDGELERISGMWVQPAQEAPTGPEEK